MTIATTVLPYRPNGSKRANTIETLSTKTNTSGYHWGEIKTTTTKDKTKYEKH